MKMKLLLVTTVLSASAVAVAAGTNANPRPLGLAEMVAHMQSTYAAEVTGIDLDNAGDKAPHYHVDLRFPHNGVARLDVDALTRLMTARESNLPSGSATLTEVANLVTMQLPAGQVTVVQLDTSYGVTPHYDVDVRVPGATARLKVEAATRSIGWREPAIIRD